MKKKMITKVEKLMNNKKWNKSKVLSAYSSCEFLFNWSEAMVKFYYVYQKVKPLQEKVDEEVKKQKKAEKE